MLTARLVSSLARAGAPMVASASRGSPEETVERWLELSEILACFAGDLKGVVAKVGQAASYYGLAVPPEAEAALGELTNDLPPAGSDSVQRAVEQELNAPIDRLFAEFEATPFATGSIGQVHGAVLLDGRSVAVKVQHPLVEEAIDDDLRALRLCVPFLQIWTPRWDHRGLLEEFGARLRRETNYRDEASQQTRFGRRLADDPSLSVPAIIESHSARRVLTSERVRGITFDELVRDGSAAERNFAGEAICRVTFRTTVCDGWFNTDVQPSNFLFSPGRVHLVDFGSVCRLGASTTAGFRALMHSLLDQDADALEAALIALGVLERGSRIDAAFALRLLSTEGQLLRCALEDKPSRFARDAVRRDMALWLTDHRDVRRLVVPPGLLYAFRAYFGCFALLARLESEVCWGPVVQGALDRASTLP